MNFRQMVNEAAGMDVSPKIGAFPMKVVSTETGSNIPDLFEAAIQAVNNCNQESFNLGFQIQVEKILLLGKSIPAGRSLDA
jgi:hypothetical protein